MGARINGGIKTSIFNPIGAGDVWVRACDRAVSTVCDKGNHPVSVGTMGGPDGPLDGGCPCGTGRNAESRRSTPNRTRVREIDEIEMAASMGTNWSVLNEVNRKHRGRGEMKTRIFGVFF